MDFDDSRFSVCDIILYKYAEAMYPTTEESKSQLSESRRNLNEQSI